VKIQKLEIENFRRIEKAVIHLEPASFVIGPNNCSKSSVIAALESLLSLEGTKLTQLDIREKPDGSRAQETVITGYFGPVSAEVAAARGFRGRVIDGQFVYRKSLSIDSTKPKIFCREQPSKLKPAYAQAKTVAHLLAAGLSAAVIKEVLELEDPAAKLKGEWAKALPEVLDFDAVAEPVWYENPGGIPQNVLSRLPRLIHIPALTDANEIESGEKKYVLGECLSLLFEDLLEGNATADQIQERLTELQTQMEPSAANSLIGGLVSEVNRIIGDVFPKCGIIITPSLQGIIEILKPKYDIKVFSNVRTPVSRQGTGLVRTCAFAMLRHHAALKLKKELQTRPVVVAFEEPELFLHPSAANLLRDTIYALGRSDQIICTTHSPWMIDLRQEAQSITRMSIGSDDRAEAWNYGVSSELGKLPADDKVRVKLVQTFDDELARVFFAEKVLIVEGDSEVAAIRETLRLLSADQRKRVQSQFQVIKARGKASIISLVKYLHALKIDIAVMHDGDQGVAGAEVFNAPIATALDNPGRLFVLAANLETVLGYAPPASDKPYKAFVRASAWTAPAEIPVAWRTTMSGIFTVTWPADA
jgi:putative ATP-dependent endonuclease of the OLD family